MCLNLCASAKKFLYGALHQPPLAKSLFFMLVVLLGSLLSSLSLVPSSRFFSDKNNSLNVYLAKYCWGWTLLFLFPLVFLSSLMYTGFDRVHTARHLGRLLVCHVFWYLVTSVFDAINHRAGWCSSDSSLQHNVCVMRGNTWVSFDISGHVFLLVYCILIISEECALVRKEVWERYEGILESKSNLLSVEQYKRLRSLQKVATPVFALLKMVSLAFLILWSTLVVASSLYFHNFLEKAIGCLCAYTFWRVAYALAELNSPYLPCPPSSGVLNPLNQ